MLKFTFAGKDSYTDFGIIISTRPTLPSPKRRVTYIEVPGRDSTLKLDDEVYDNITIAVECAIKGDHIVEQLDMIKAWLYSSEESDLIFSFQPDKKYLAQVVNSIDYKQVFKVVSQFVIVFNCRPFKYAVDNDLITISSGSGTTILNPGSIASRPVIKVYGSGGVDVYINSNVIRLNDIDEYVVIDSELMDCYRDTELKNNQMNGDFPVLEPGDNDVSWAGNVTKVEIIPNWRWL